ncbi:tetratricopeptide repeat protein [Streptomyces sp. NPDC020412]|uniref:tetratricopeptide repeat protein n=1 Tax=Streptomyces sp. NPDC020412 TaxID=3365073 RepID=UPI0037AF6D73
MEARTLLQLLVWERGWTYSRFRRAYESAAREVAAAAGGSPSTATVEEQTFRRWTAGRVRGIPNQPAPEVLEYMFGQNVRALFSPPSEPPPGASHVLTINESDLAMTARDAASHAGDAASLSVPDMTLDQLDDDIVALARAYNRTSPFEVYRRAKELLGIAQAMLERTQVPRQRERGYLAAGQSAAVLSAICFDLGSLPAAVSLSRTAALYGQVVEHGPLQAYAHGALAFLAYWGGRPAEAVRLVRTAQQFGGLGDTAMTRLLVIEGRAHGHLGNLAEAERAIRNALSQSTGSRDQLHDDIGGEFGFPSDRVAMSNATTYLLLGDSGGAEEAAAQALRLLSAEPEEERPLLVETQAHVDLARARLLRGELDGVQAALEPAFNVPVEWRGAGTLERMAAVRTGLCHPDFHGAGEASTLGERIEEFTAAASAQRLGVVPPLAIDP